MKKSFIIASVAVIALASSCNLFNNSTKGQVVKVDESSNVAASEFVDLRNNPLVLANPSGLAVTELSAEPVQKTISLSDQKVPFGAEFVFEGDKLPEAAKPVKGATDNAGILLDVKNPTDKDLILDAVVEVDGKSTKITDIQIPAKRDFSVLIAKDKDEKIIPTINVPDEIIPSKGIVEVVGKDFDELKVKDIELRQPATKAIAPAAETANITIGAKYCVALSFPAGTVISIHKSFKDLKINLDRLNVYTFNKYDVALTVTNPMPFEIAAVAISEEGVTAESKAPVKAGTPSAPVTSQAVIRVVDHSGNKVSEIGNADLTLSLTAASAGAVIPADANLKISVDTITVVDE